MNERDLVLVVYAGILGWYLHKWWQGTREELVWDTAERVSRRMDIWERARGRKPDPEPAPAGAGLGVAAG